MAVEKIRFMLSAQVNNGGGLPLVKFTHNPGHEDTPDDASYVQETGHPAYRADDALWLFPTVYKYISETGNLEFIDEVIPFANKEEGTVYEHLKRAVDFSMNHLGKHGMPAGLYADWNDCFRLGKDGESTFVALQFYYAMTILKCKICLRFICKSTDHRPALWVQPHICLRICTLSDHFTILCETTDKAVFVPTEILDQFFQLLLTFLQIIQIFCVFLILSKFLQNCHCIVEL